MVERRRIIKAKKKSPCEICEDELGKEGSFYNRETKECDCKKDEGYLLDKANSRCIKCSGNGAFIKFGKCHCGAGSVFQNGNEIHCTCPIKTTWNGHQCESICDEEGHFTLENGRCVCQTDYLESTDQTCVPCSGPAAHLVENTCSCGENHLKDGSKCIECGGPGAVVVDHQCSCELQHYRLSPAEKVCHCPSDFVLTPTGSCLPCAGGHVSNNSCTCPEGHLYSSLSVSCIKCFGGQLDNEENCTCPENHVLWKSEAKCVKCFGDGSSLDQIGGQCTCEGPSLLSSIGQCVRCSGPGASLQDDQCHCKNGILNSETATCVTCNGPGSYLTKNGKCKCKKKSQLSSEGTCVPCFGDGKILDGLKCICDSGFIQSETGECIRCEGEGSFLRGDECSCDHEYILSGNKCVKCHGAGSYLTQSGNCYCHEGFILSDDSSTCTRCEGPGAFIKDNRCACDAKFSILNFQKIACVSCFGLGAALDKNNNCVCGDLNSFPDPEKGCTCETGYQRSSEGTCIPCEGALTEEDECMCPEDTFLTSTGACITCPPGSTVNQNYSERMGTAGEICVCEEGTQLSPDASQCLPCTGPGSALDENGVCYCTGTFYMKEPGVCAMCAGGIENSTANECTCPEGSMVYEDIMCIPCQGPTSVMSATGNCVCDEESAMLSQDKSTCNCRVYFLEAKMTSTCVSCFGDGAYLNELDECQCRNGSQLRQGDFCDYPEEVRREPIFQETTMEMTTAAVTAESDVSLIIIPWVLLLLLLLILLQFCWLYCKRNIVTKIPIEENSANEPELDELIAPKSTVPVEKPQRRVSTPVVIPPTPEPRTQFNTAGTSTDVEYKPLSRDQEMQTSMKSLASVSSQQSSSSSWTMANTPIIPHTIQEVEQQQEREPISPPQVAVNIVGANDAIANWDYQRDVAYYIVSCIKLYDDDKDERMVKLSPEETQTLIPALQADSEYQVLVTAFDYDNKYKCSQHLRVVTKGSPPGPPQRITFDNIDDQSVHVSWGEPPDIDTRITKYLFLYYPTKNPKHKQVLPLPGSQRTIAISKLKKSEEYTFEIRAETRWGLGEAQTSTVTIDQMKSSDRNSIFFAESISDLTRQLSYDHMNKMREAHVVEEASGGKDRQRTGDLISSQGLSMFAQVEADTIGPRDQTGSKTMAKVTLTTETIIGRVAKQEVSAQQQSQSYNQAIEETQMYRKIETDGNEDLLQSLGPKAMDLMRDQQKQEKKEEVLVPVEVASSYELDSEVTDVLRVQLRNQYQPLYDDTEAYPSSLDDEPVSTLNSEQASHFQHLAGRGGEPADDSSEAYVSEYQSEADEPRSGSFHFENLIHTEATERQSLLQEESVARMEERIRQSSNSSELEESAHQSRLSVATCIEKPEGIRMRESTTSNQSRSQADLLTNVYESNAISAAESEAQKATFRKSTTEVYDAYKHQQKLNIYENISSGNIMESIGSVSVHSDDKEKEEETRKSWTFSL